MPAHLPCMREDLNLLLTRAPWRIPMMLPQAAQTTLMRLLSQVTQTIVLPRMLCQVTQALTGNHKKVIQLNLHIGYSTCISIQIFALLLYLQLQQKNIQLLLMTMKLRMKMEKLKGLLSMSHTVVGGITVCYGTHLWSLVLQARAYHCDCIILAFHSTYETQQNILVKLGGLTLGISKVFQISLKSSYKIQLILAFLTVLFMFLYLLWGTRTGNCFVFFLFTFSSLESPRSTGSYYTPLERYE